MRQAEAGVITVVLSSLYDSMEEMQSCLAQRAERGGQSVGCPTLPTAPRSHWNPSVVEDLLGVYDHFTLFALR